MDIQATIQQQQPVSDDNELAKVLGGSDDSGAAPQAAAPPMADVAATDASPQLSTAPPATEDPTVDLAPPPIGGAAPTLAAGELDTIKKAALEELRPLADKLNLPPEEKFDTLLLIIRSTDDKELISVAHEAAKAIPDETRRAQALLDIIKEIEYFSTTQQAPVAPAL